MTERDDDQTQPRSDRRTFQAAAQSQKPNGPKLIFEGLKIAADFFLDTKTGKKAKAKDPYLQMAVDGIKLVGDICLHDPVEARREADARQAYQEKRRQVISDNAKAAMQYATNLVEGSWISRDRKLCCKISQPNIAVSEIDLVVLDKNRPTVSGRVLIYDANQESDSYIEPVPLAPPFHFTATVFELDGNQKVHKCCALDVQEDLTAVAIIFYNAFYGPVSMVELQRFEFVRSSEADHAGAKNRNQARLKKRKSPRRRYHG
jgi:hypothetical protein